MKFVSLRQRCAKYIVDNPGCSMLEILAATQLIPKGVNGVCKTLKAMVDAEELTRKGNPTSYTYAAGPNIMDAVNGLKTPPNKPVGGRRGVPNHKGGILTIRQTWVHAGDYRIEPGEMIYRSLWDYADSFVTGATKVVEM
jgi:hypothetical protein